MVEETRAFSEVNHEHQKTPRLKHSTSYPNDIKVCLFPRHEAALPQLTFHKNLNISRGLEEEGLVAVGDGG